MAARAIGENRGFLKLRIIGDGHFCKGIRGLLSESKEEARKRTRS
jgi:hypothetical protein